MELLLNPHPYQRDGIDFAYLTKYSLNGDRMGLGKTLQALGLAAKINKGKTLVVCPAFLILNWRSEIQKFLGKVDGKFDVVSYDSLKKIGSSFGGYSLIIADEHHYVKTLSAARTKVLHALMARHRPEYFLGLSGTPIKNRIPELYSPLRLCWLGGNFPQFDRYSQSFWIFNRHFTNQQTIRFGSKTVQKFEGVRNVGELKELLRPVYIRRKAEDVLCLPPSITREIVVAEKSAVDTALERAWEAYNGEKADRSFSSGKAVSALSKVPFTVELATEILDSTGSVIIYSDHVQAAEAIAGAFRGTGMTSACVTGSTSMETRHKTVEALNAGKLKVLVSTIGSLSVGVNLTGCSHMVFNDFPWVPADLDQAMARIRRIGQSKTCFYYFMFASAFDKHIFKTIAKKKEVIEKVGV